ncbi:nucleosome assembly protein [Podospora australis]|uniref:Nucleosome assembly protein n=1 Tax=Podospora australis TaxID=1536484 RepID=A0AAN6WRH0_9PEZI|nr:nucleosome assembly protein [Podospora australis]
MVLTITPEEIMATYEQLAQLEEEFDEVEMETIRHQYKLTKPLYAKRAEVVSKIENFWPLVLEQAPMDIDEFIQPADSAALLSSIQTLSVSRFEIDSGVEGGDPRSINIKFDFKENEWFENKTLEKKFWWRHGKDGWSGYVSEPVEIQWKEGKDLTNGLLKLSKAVWEEQKASKEKKKDTEAQKALKAAMEENPGGVSFFCFFGFTGPNVSAEESKEVVLKRKAGEEDEEMEDENEEDWEDEEEDEYEIFPDGDTVAMAIADDLFPNALKYFTHAQEDEGMSDLEFESGEEDSDEEEEDEKAGAKPTKKHKACAHGCKH